MRYYHNNSILRNAIVLLALLLGSGTTMAQTIGGSIYGGGKGTSAVVTGAVTVQVDTGNITKDVYGGGALANVDGTTTVSFNGGTIGRALYGGGLGNNTTAVTVSDAVQVTVSGGAVDSVFGCNNVNGAPQSTVAVNITGSRGTIANVFGGGNMAYCTVSPSVSVSGGVVANVFGGGNNITEDGRGVGGSAVTISGGSVTTGVYGGCNTKGVVEGDITVSVTGGTIGTDAVNTANVHGGGYGSNTSTTGSVHVTIDGAAVHVYGDVYGGSALGSVNTYNAGKTTTVDILNGTLHGNIYGGGLGDGTHAATVNGEVTVNIGAATAPGCNPTGDAILLGNVYGCNNANGTPQDNVTVNIYKAHRTPAQEKTGTEYSIANVFGGGNMANYNPRMTDAEEHDADPEQRFSHKKAKVFIHGCDNTVENVYGGCNQADAVGTEVEIDGGHYNWVFGGGNGMHGPANIGKGGLSLVIHGGHVGFAYEGCNYEGDVLGPKSKDFHTPSLCNCEPYTADYYFFGANEAVTSHDLYDTVHCGDDMHYKYLYGGSRLADIYGNITLVIEGGEFDNVFGGSQGATATQDSPEKSATVYGDITIILRGGKIGNVYGGCDKVGNVTGKITIIVDSNQVGACALDIDTIFGGSNLAKYEPLVANVGSDFSPLVSLENGHVNANVFGGGRGSATDVDAGLVTSNPKVSMTGDNFWVKGNIYGGGELATVGTFNRDANGKVTGYNTASGAAGTGKTTVELLAGKVGPASMPKDFLYGYTGDNFEKDRIVGMVFGAGRGIVGDTTANGNPKITHLAYVNSSDVIIGKADHTGGPFVKGSVYGGSQNGHVYTGGTHVQIRGGQVGCGAGETAPYDEVAFIDPLTTADNDIDAAALAECPSWRYTNPHAPFDLFASTVAGHLDEYPDGSSTNGGRRIASDGHTFYGNVFGGGSGYFPYAPGKWLHYAGRVEGSTLVEITGGHILTSVYGGNEMTDVVGDSCVVVMSGGTLGVPRTLDSILAHPVTCYLFGAGKGDPRSLFNQTTDVNNVRVTVKGSARVYGSVFGGGEDGHVLENVKVEIENGTIGTWGTSYVDGNVFGGGRGFNGSALTAGVVIGKVDVNISNGTMLGSIYGGGRLAPVGTRLLPPDSARYGWLQDDGDHGVITVDISGGTIGNDREYVYVPAATAMNAAWRATNHLPLTMFEEALDSGAVPIHKLVHTKGGNVFGGSMGRTTLLDGNLNPLWPSQGVTRESHVTIRGNARIKSSVYGGGEIGTVRDSTVVTIAGNAVIGTEVQDGGETKYHFGGVYGGGYGDSSYVASSPSLEYHTRRLTVNNAPTNLPAVEIAGRVYGNTYVRLEGGHVYDNVFGGGDMASVGTPVYDNSGEVDHYVDNTGNTSVTVTGGEVGPLDYTGMNAYVYAAGKGVGNDPNEHYKKYCNVVNTDLIVSGGTIWGSLFGGGADCHVLGDASVTVHDGANVGTYGITTYDGNIFGGGRNYLHTNTTAGRVAGNITVTMDGGEIQGSLFGGGRMAMTGVDIDGGVDAFLDGNGKYDSIHHGLVTINVSGGSIGYHGDASEATPRPTGYRLLMETDESLGDIFGAGKGDTKDYERVWAGRVMNTKINISGTPRIYGSVFGGGEMAGIGWWTGAGSSQFTPQTGTSTVIVEGSPEIGTDYEFSTEYKANPSEWTEYYNFGSGVRLAHTCTGNVYGASQGDVDPESPAWVQMARSRQTFVTIGGATGEPIIKGDVFGGAEQGTVIGDTRLIINRGTIGSIMNPGTDSMYYFGSVFAGGYGSDSDTIHDNDSNNVQATRIAGNTYGNTYVEINGGTIRHNVYGGGSLASVGTFTRAASGMPTACTAGTGKSKVYVKGGTIGVDGRENGIVFGSSRGYIGAPDSETDFQAWTSADTVIIGDTTVAHTMGTPLVKGSVYGGGENGHVLADAYVRIFSGTVGCSATEYDVLSNYDKEHCFPYRGNVYGAGCGTDMYDSDDDGTDDAYNRIAGMVLGNTRVDITGGYISRNVYGGGAMGSVGIATSADTNKNADTSFAISWPYVFTFADDNTGTATVNITGGHIGTVAASDVSGDVYGSARGEAGDRYVMGRLANVRNSYVNIDFERPTGDVINDATANVIVGSVYGSGENGHVIINTNITLNGGLIGGSLYGGGKGVDTYLDTLYDVTTEQKKAAPEQVHSITAGKVYGNTYVTMNDGLVKKNVYGGGNMASVGKGNYRGYGENKTSIPAGDPDTTNTGHCYVNIYGGTIGTDGNENGHVFGSSRGIAFAMVTKNPRINYSRDFFLAYANSTYVTIGNPASPDSTSTNPRIHGSVFGGGESGHVRNDAYVQINKGEIGSNLTKAFVDSYFDTCTAGTTKQIQTAFEKYLGQSEWSTRGNIYGAGRGMDKYDSDGDGIPDTYCQSAGSVTRNTRVDINGGKIYRNVYGGGSLATVGPPPGYTSESSTCTVNINSGVGMSEATVAEYNKYKHYGGYVGGGSRGLSSPAGNSHENYASCANTVVNINSGYVHNTIYGGGEFGQIAGNTRVNINGGKVRASVYGGGKGAWKDSSLEGDHSNDTISGRIKGSTQVNLLGGNVQYVYGGSARANIWGTATVNIGDPDTTCVGTTIRGNVYGCNQYVGSPYGDVRVNVYKTAHTADNTYTAGTVTNDTTLAINTISQKYAINEVYGGGYQASYLPKENHSAVVHVYYCNNTIKTVYGGGSAADIGSEAVHANDSVIVDGGRIYRIFGGGYGRGTNNPGANVYGTAATVLHGGVVNDLFGGSDSLGNIINISSIIDHTSECDEFIGTLFGGSNESPIFGNGSMTIACGAGDFGEVYGGCNMADIGTLVNPANITLTIQGGIIENVYGGSRGDLASLGVGHVDQAANIYGNVTLNLEGGIITRAFGGSKYNGNITGTITVNVNDKNINTPTACALHVGNIYGAGDQTAYTPTNASALSPVVNVMHTTDATTLTGDVFGGGYGAPAIVTANPVVTIGDDDANHTALVGGKVYGGGSLAKVSGSTQVQMKNANSRAAMLFGGGAKADVTGNTAITVTDGVVTGGIEHGGIFGGCDEQGSVDGNVTIDLNGGTLGADGATANVHGGGYGQPTVVKGNVDITVDGATIWGDVYGGSALGNVNGTVANDTYHTNVTLTSGTIHGDLYGGGQGQTSPLVEAKVFSPVQVRVNGGSVDGGVYGGNYHAGAPQRSVNVDVYGTAQPISGYAINKVFGGGNEAAYAGIPVVTVHKCNNKIHYIYGGGNAAPVQGTNVTVWGGDTIGNVYGGCYGSDVTANGTNVTIHGGTIGSVFGGNDSVGEITGAINVIVNKDAEGTDPACDMHISRLYGGGNHANSSAGIISIGCTGGDNEGIDSVYGGANQAIIDGKIVLNITGGRINNLFGGNNVSGNVTDSIVININWDNSCANNYLGTVYGAGNLAEYRPNDTTISSPIVNLINGMVSGNIYGGGYGIASETKKGLVNANPIVNIGDNTVPNAEAFVKGDVNGGGARAQVVGNTVVNMRTGTIGGNLFGAGEGVETNPVSALVMKNSTVNMTGGRVKGSVYGGGDVASVGYYNTYDGAHLPVSCEPGTGHTAVFISGGTVGPDKLKMPTFKGHVFGGGKGRVADPDYNHNIANLGYSNTTELVVSGDAFIKGSVYGGSESGHVFDSTYVRIQGGQIGAGFDYTADTNYSPYTKWDTTQLAECHHWPYDSLSNLTYDPYADSYYSEGGAVNATDGHTYYGNVFGGGSGVFPYQPVGRVDTAVWSRTAGAVYGNTRVEVSGGHILTSLYGGNEMTNVGTYITDDSCKAGTGIATVIMTDGTLGVPRTYDSIRAHPVTCYLFGAGKGDPRIFFNTTTNIDSAYIHVSGGRIYGSIFGGGEDGHVLRNISLNVDGDAYIGTLGTTYVDGNIFGAGRGFSGEALTAGTVGGNVTVNLGGNSVMLGNVYGGGRLASVGTLFTAPNDPGYGHMIEGPDHGYITINIGDNAVVGTDSVFGNDRPSHLRTGNVYGGSMGRLELLNGNTNPLWPRMAKVKNTQINITGNATIRASVYGGAELGTVTGDTRVNVTGENVKIGTTKLDNNSGDVLYRFGSVLGGGYGTDKTEVIDGVASNRIAGRVYGSTEVNLSEGTVANNVFGGGKMAYIGNDTVAGSGNTTVNIGNDSQPSNSVVIGNVIYGANDNTGSPLGNTNVHIYRTAHAGNNIRPADSAAYVAAQALALADNEVAKTHYALQAVYGGGNLADYTPFAGKGTYVFVHNCDNTIKMLYGGGRAADAGTSAVPASTNVTVDGGRIDTLFGGGDGHTKDNLGNYIAADVFGDANTTVNGGYYTAVFGGSNTAGVVHGTRNIVIDKTATCDQEEIIGNIYGGGNQAEGGGGELTIGCGAGHFISVFGGSNNANITSDITLNIQGGTIDTVFGGNNRGGDILGNIEVNLTGGTLGYVFGGSNFGDTVKGNIVINIDSTQAADHCPLTIAHNVYGGGHMAPTKGNDREALSPIVNVKHGTVQGDVYGGGYGAGSRVMTNPKVVVGNGDYTSIAKKPVVKGDIFGGGQISRIFGSTDVEVQDGTVEGSVYGSGKGVTDLSDPEAATRAQIDGHTSVTISGGHVWGNLYGGGELATVGHIDSRNASKYDSETPAAQKLYGLSTVTVSGGQVGREAEVGNAAQVAAGTHREAGHTWHHKGHVYGGGHGRAGAAWTDHANVDSAHVVITGGYVVGSVFGGGENGHVKRSTVVEMSGGTIGQPLTLAERRVDDMTHGLKNYCGNIYGAGRGIETDDEGHYSHTSGRVYGNASVSVTGGTVRHAVFGGGSLASVGTFDEVNIGTDAAPVWRHRYTEGTGTTTVVIGGDALIGPKKADIVSTTVATQDTNFKYLGGNEGLVYGGSRGISGSEYAELAFVHTTDVTVEGNAQVAGAVFGGGEDGHVKYSTNVKVQGDATVGGIPLHDAGAYTVSGSEYDGLTLTLGAGQSEVDHQTTSGNYRHIYRGNVYGGGRGVDHDDIDANLEYSYSAGKVYGNTHVVIDGNAKVYNSVYGGGSIATVGTYDDPTDPHQATDMIIYQNPAQTIHTGLARVEIKGGTIGTTGHNNGHVYGGCRGIAAGVTDNEGGEGIHLSFVDSTNVVVSDGEVKGSVFGGGANGHVLQNTCVLVSGGTIGIPGFGGSEVGNVYGGGRGEDSYYDEVRHIWHLSRTAGLVFGNANVCIVGGQIWHNVYGGGSQASVGKLTPGTAGSSNPDNVIAAVADGTGLATVYITGGIIGRNGNENGIIFGSSRGDIAAIGNFQDTLAWVGATKVIIGDTTAAHNMNSPQIKGSVYGGGENGHVKKDAYIHVYSGRIGYQNANPAADRNDNLYAYRGNVYGAGCGTDKYDSDGDGNDDAYNYYAGVVQGNTRIKISGGHIVHNVYGGGAMANVGGISSAPVEHHESTQYALIWPVDLAYIDGTGTATIDITGGRIGTIGDIDGNVYGGARGEDGDNSYAMALFGNVNNTVINIAYEGEVATLAQALDTFDIHPCITGAVHGGAQNGHVYADARVALARGLVGDAIYGGGKGSSNSLTAGNVYGNTYVTMTDGQVGSQVYGGGELGRVKRNANVHLTGGSVGGNIFGAGKGLASDASSGTVFGNTYVDMSDGMVSGSLYGGGEMGSVGNYTSSDADTGGFSQVIISGGTIGNTTPYRYFLGDIPADLRDNTYETVVAKNIKYYDTVGNSVNTVEIKTANVPNILTHTASGNVYGGCMGNTTLDDGTTVNPLWPSLARCRKTRVTISDNAVVRSSVYGGGELGTVIDSTTVNILGGTIGTDVTPADATAKATLRKYSNKERFKDFYTNPQDPDYVDSDTLLNPHYYFGSVYGGGYGSHDTVVSAVDLVYSNIPSLTDNHAPARLASVDIAGRVFGRTYVHVKGGTTIRENVFGGGDVASVGTSVYDGSSHIFQGTDTTGKKGVCVVTIANDTVSGNILRPVIGPLDFTGNNGNVYAAGKGVGNDPQANYKYYCNVDSSYLTVSGGRIHGSTFGGGADCHVLGSTHTHIGNTSIVNGVEIGDRGITEYDGYVFGGGRNFQNTNNTAGRVQGNTHVDVTGGRIKCTIIGGGSLARTGVDMDGDIASFVTAGVYDSIHHGSTFVNVSGTTETVAPFTAADSVTYRAVLGTTDTASGQVVIYHTALGTGYGPYLLDCDYSIGDIFGGGKGDTRDTVDITAGRVMNTYINVSGSPRIMADIYAGGEMGCIGWYDVTGAHTGEYYDRTGYTHVEVNGTPYLGTPYEFTTENFRAGVTWSIVDPDTKRLLHTCSGNIYGGGQGFVEEGYTNWVSMGRVRRTEVTINGVRMLGHVFGGGSRGVVTENTYVTVTGGHIGTVIRDTVAGAHDTLYYYGSVFAGGYGNPKKFLHVNDSCRLDEHGDPVQMIPTEYAGRIYGNSYLNVTGGHIMECVFGGGDLASTGYVKADGTLVGGACYVNIGGTAEIGPLDYSGMNAYVYGAGRGMAYDDEEEYTKCSNVNTTHLTVSGGKVWGSLFGGGADSHVLGDVNTTVHDGADVGTAGITSYDGNIFGAGRNYLNANRTAGRVQGNIYVTMDGGTLMGTVFGGGRMAMSGVDADGNYIDSLHGNVVINVSGGSIGNPDSRKLLTTWESNGDIFGSGKGDTQIPYTEKDAGRVNNSSITVSGSPRIYGSIFGGGEMASLGYWDDSSVFYENSGRAVINISGSPEIGTDDEFNYYLMPVDPENPVAPQENPGDWTIYNADGTLLHSCTGNVFGGCQGDVDAEDSPAWVSLGRSASSNIVISGSPIIKGDVFGGAEQGIVTGNTHVTVSGGTIGTHVDHDGFDYYFGSVFGGGYGSDDPAEDTLTIPNDSTAARQAMGLPWTPLALAGRVYGDAQVVINGSATIRHNVFGGAGMAYMGYKKSDGTTIGGNIHLSIGDSTQSSNNVVILGDVYGANNLNGSPYGDVKVDIWKTAHVTSGAGQNDTADAATAYALQNVFGGGNQADYEAEGKRTFVHIHNCDNTVMNVYGGGNAAAVPGARLIVDGGRFDNVFGGGNGEVTAANVGTGGTNTSIRGGKINHFYGGGNMQGVISGKMVLTIDTTGGQQCSFRLDTVFGGGNQAGGDSIEVTIACGTQFDAVFGGANNADIGDADHRKEVILNVLGGDINRVFGGNNTGGTVYADVTVNIYGGSIDEVFGGSNLGGNIIGNITVNIDSNRSDCPLSLNYVYGGGNLVSYVPDSTHRVGTDISAPYDSAYSKVDRLSPLIRLKQGTVKRDIYGGGKGYERLNESRPPARPKTLAEWTAEGHADYYTGDVAYNDSLAVYNEYVRKVNCAKVMANPQVYVGTDNNYHVRVGEKTVSGTGNVYGGGDAAPVQGNTKIDIRGNNTAIYHNVYGAGNAAVVTGNTDIQIGDHE